MFGPRNLEEAKRTVTAMVLEPVLYFSGPSHETIKAVIRVANNCSTQEIFCAQHAKMREGKR